MSDQDTGAAPGAQANAEGAGAPTLNIHGQYIKDLSFEAPNAPAIFQAMQSNQPDITINYFDGQGEYQTAYTQTDECYVAVAAITDTEVGQVAEIHLPWTIIPPISPPNQTAK